MRYSVNEFLWRPAGAALVRFARGSKIFITITVRLRFTTYAVSPSRWTCTAPTVKLVYLLNEVILDTHLVDLIELSFNPVDVVLFILQYVLEDFSGSAIAQLAR